MLRSKCEAFTTGFTISQLSLPQLLSEAQMKYAQVQLWQQHASK